MTCPFGFRGVQGKFGPSTMVMQRCGFFAGEGTSEHLEVFIFNKGKKRVVVLGNGAS